MELHASNTVSVRWKSNCDARMDWAFEAYEQLVASLSPDVSARMASGGQEAYVVVFGRTQVGKTTLLLELMGVNASSIERVSDVLRGGRGKGLSSTATVMEYGRSSSVYWSLQLPHQQPEMFVADDLACAALRSLREQMESQQLCHDGPVRLEIPCDCFSPELPGHAHVRMLDLPGDQASNPVEQAHVARVADRYVAGADLILLVGKMDDLSFLKPGGVLLPGIEDWQIVPERFRIITTYSFTAQSVQSSVLKSGLNINNLRIRLLEQLETFGRLSPEARRPDLLFPLEFGQSLARTAAYDPQLVEQIEPIVAALKLELAAQINAATSPMARLRMALRSHLMVAKVKEHKLQEMEQVLSVLAARAEVASKNLAIANKKLALASNKCHELRLKVEQLLAAQPQNKVSDICTLDDSAQRWAVFQSAQSVKALQACLNDFRSWLRRTYLSLSAIEPNGVGDPNWFWRGVRISLEDDLPAIRRLLDDNLGVVESHLNSYWVDSYWSDSSYEKDTNSVVAAMFDATAQCRDLALTRWRSAVDLSLHALKQKFQSSVEGMELDRQLVLDLSGEDDRSKEAVTNYQSEIRRFEEKMSADQARCQSFTSMLDERYEWHLTSLVNRVRNSSHSALAFIDLLSGLHLIDTRSQLLATAVPGAEPISTN